MDKKRGLRIASYNINGINTRLHLLLRWLEEFAPDVVGLQELKCTDEAFPAKEIEGLGYSVIWHGQRSWNGVAILSRVGEPVETCRGLPGDPDDSHSRYVEAAVCGILIGNLYLPNGNPWPGPKFDYKLAWMDRLHAHARALLDSGVPAMLIGDFNVIPTPQDVYKPERWAKDALYSPEARAKFAELLAQGWTDALRELYPDERIYTFWHYWRNAFERDAGIRIDHLLLSPPLARKLKAAGVDRTPRGWEKPSDHAPTWVDVEV
jgi:exodeoxyribonuclease-3